VSVTVHALSSPVGDPGGPHRPRNQRHRVVDDFLVHDTVVRVHAPPLRAKTLRDLGECELVGRVRLAAIPGGRLLI